MGYYLTRKAAELAIKAVFPVVYCADHQVPVRISRTMGRQVFLRRCPGDWPELERMPFWAVSKGLVGHSFFALHSDMTPSGDKPWIEKENQSRKAVL
jgi:hypothetical protein